MPRIFKLDLTVAEEATDEFGHVNNQRYIAWMQDVATAHSAANGWPMERYLGIGAAWVVRSHFIEYLRPAFAGDGIEIFTWAASLALREVSRKYLFRRAGDRQSSHAPRPNGSMSTSRAAVRSACRRNCSPRSRRCRRMMRS